MSKKEAVIKNIEWMEKLYFPWGILIVAILILILAYISKKSQKADSRISFSGTTIVLVGLLVYTFYFIPMYHLFPFYKRVAAESLPRVIEIAIMHPTSYTILVNFATLSGLFAVLLDNRIKMKNKPNVLQKQVQGLSNKIKELNKKNKELNKTNAQNLESIDNLSKNNKKLEDQYQARIKILEDRLLLEQESKREIN